jgi:sugar-specific transcriptional regulator TrmB
MLYILYHAVTARKYLGQSKRQFSTRLKEHQKAVSTLNKEKSALAEHVCVTPNTRLRGKILK